MKAVWSGDPLMKVVWSGDPLMKVVSPFGLHMRVD